MRELQRNSHITSGKTLQGIAAGVSHNRSIFSETQKGFYVAKGSGFNDWTKDSDWHDTSFEYQYKDSVRKFPIVREIKTDIYSHLFVGGSPSDIFETEFVGCLMLIDACRKMDVEPFCQVPLMITKPQELPLIHNGSLKIVERDDYCDNSYYNEKSDGDVLSLNDFQKLGIFYYWSFNPVDRIPIGGHIEGIESERLERLKRAVSGFARTIAAFHKNGGRFSDEKMSPLSYLNVSIDGIIHDMDTFIHGALGETLPDRRVDLRIAVNSVKRLTDIAWYRMTPFEDFARQKEKNNEMRKLFLSEYKSVYQK